jgi:cytochrome c-type biogenesis protein CcmE|tara:strand:+ start:272 stop:697 length:426 start_codon:yes stop_codon:yes gene_type:complete
MYGKKVKLRFVFLSSIFLIIILSVYLILKSLEENVVYFISPSEIKTLSEINNNKKIRVGGMVKEDSIKMDQNTVNFVITDFKNEINVTYSGAIPNLFAEGKGVVAEGFLNDRNYLKAKKILAKHDENYMPPEVKEALEKKN